MKTKITAQKYEELFDMMIEKLKEILAQKFEVIEQ